MMSSVFVNSAWPRVGRPTGGRPSGFNRGWIARSPIGTIHRWSPVLRSMAVMRPYGGFHIGTPSSVSIGPGTPIYGAGDTAPVDSPS